jgi:phosphohistidine phosphatase
VRAITIAVTSLAVVFATSGGVAAQEQDGPALPSYDVRTASGPPGKASSGGATTVVGRTDGFLTAPSGRSAQEVARAFLRGNAEALGLATSDVADLAVTDAYTSGIGTRHLTFDQVVDGVAVYGGQVMANVDAKGRLINVSGEPVSGLDLDTTTPDLSKVQALHRARADVGGEPSGGFGEIESASLVAFPGAKRTAELACEVLGVPVEEDDRLKGGDFDPLEVAAGRGEVMLVGHEPDFSQAVALATGSRVKIKKGGIAAIDDHLLHLLMRPNDLSAIAA